RGILRKFARSGRFDGDGPGAAVFLLRVNGNFISSFSNFLFPDRPCTAFTTLSWSRAVQLQAISKFCGIWPQFQRVVLVLPDFGQLERDFCACNIPVAEGGTYRYIRSCFSIGSQRDCLRGGQEIVGRYTSSFFKYLVENIFYSFSASSSREHNIFHNNRRFVVHSSFDKLDNEIFVLLSIWCVLRKIFEGNNFLD